MHLFSAFTTGIGCFMATNLDDLVLLILLFSQLESQLERSQIVAGQYLGFGLLVLVSLPGFLGSLIWPQSWVGLLGLVPILLGLDRLLDSDATQSDLARPDLTRPDLTRPDLTQFDQAQMQQAQPELSQLNPGQQDPAQLVTTQLAASVKPVQPVQPILFKVAQNNGGSRGMHPAFNVDPQKIGIKPVKPTFGQFLTPQTYSIAALTIANGSDNISLYVPLFADCPGPTLAMVLAVFFSLVGIWCYAADQLTRLPRIADRLTQSGSQLVPYLWIGLGTMILWDSQTLADRGLLVIASLIGLGHLLVSHRILATQRFRQPAQSPNLKQP